MPSFISSIVRHLATVAVFVLGAGTAMAQESGVRSASLELGGGERVSLVRFGIQGNLPYRWMEGNGKHLGTYWEGTLAYWRGTDHQNVSGRRQHLADIGFTPVLRYMADNGRGWYAEGGIGVHLLSQLYDNNDKQLSTAFQFGDHLGTGYVFANGWDLGVKIQHFSNGSIKKPNDGVNFLVVKLARPF
jgi:hypothetical protein